MQTTLVRAFVVALAVAGFSAASASSHAVTTASAHVSSTAAPLGPPAPVCAPSDPSHCGMD